MPTEVVIVAIIAAIPGILSAIATVIVGIRQQRHKAVSIAMADAIKTNHGSKNLGDAIDKISEKLNEISRDVSVDRAALGSLFRKHEVVVAAVDDHADWSDSWVKTTERRLATSEMIADTLGIHKDGVLQAVKDHIQDLKLHNDKELNQHRTD